MTFNSIPFIVFFAIFYICYLLLRKQKSRILLILGGSYIFYGWWDWRFLFLILFSTTVDYFIGQHLFKEKSNHKRKKLLIISLVTNLGLLFIFKYFNFFLESAIDILLKLGLSPSEHTLKIILPVGISFYTFQSLSYTIDIFREKLKPTSDFLVLASYIAFFPQLVAGPIIRAIDLLPQFNSKRIITSEYLSMGILLILLGYFKKLVVADSIAPLVDHTFSNVAGYSSLNILIIVFLYSFQIYCDFSGYSDIAIGLGKMLGYNFSRNFNLPYLSKNIKEFWQRWHISLSNWLRDYLYIPLGGNRKGKIVTYRNLMITMLLGGLWHGANWTFIIWGVIHGIFLILQKLINPAFLNIQKNFPSFIVSLLGILFTYFMVNFAWIFFRCQSVSEAFEIIEKISSLKGVDFYALQFKFQLIKISFVVGILIFGEISYYLYGEKIKTMYLANPILGLLICALLGWMILLFGTFSNNNFIYFQF